MKGELWQECEECGAQPVCSECFQCERHCTCSTEQPHRSTRPRPPVVSDTVIEYDRIMATPVTLDGVPAQISGGPTGEHAECGATIVCVSGNTFRYAQYSWPGVRQVIDQKQGRFRYEDSQARWEYTDRDRAIHVLNATPMFADVLSGAIPRPHEPAQSESELDWVRQTPAWQQMKEAMKFCETETERGLRLMPAWLLDDRQRLAQVLNDFDNTSPLTVIVMDSCCHYYAVAFNADGTRAAWCETP